MVDPFVIGVAFSRLATLAQNPANVRTVRKFGRCEAVGNSAFEAIWSIGGTYPWQSSSQELFVASTDAGDAGDVLVWGTEDDHTYTAVRVTIAGQTKVSLGSSFVNLERARTVADFDGNINAGFGTFTAGVPDTHLLQVLAGDGATKMCLGVVPLGFVALVSKFRSTTSKASDVKLCMKAPGYSWWDVLDERLSDDGAIEEAFPAPSAGPGADENMQPIYYPAGTQVMALGKAVTSANVVTVTAWFTLVKVPDTF